MLGMTMFRIFKLDDVIIMYICSNSFVQSFINISIYKELELKRSNLLG